MLPAIVDESTWQRLAEAAEEACAHAHAPYSGFAVGAALLTAEGRIFSGCNVENASYGLTVCAERNAAFAAVTASDGRPQLSAVYITSVPRVPAPPCGACRQVLAEFGNPLVSFLGDTGRRTMALADLLPIAFA